VTYCSFQVKPITKWLPLTYLKSWNKRLTFIEIINLPVAAQIDSINLNWITILGRIGFSNNNFVAINTASVIASRHVLKYSVLHLWMKQIKLKQTQHLLSKIKRLNNVINKSNHWSATQIINILELRPIIQNLFDRPPCKIDYEAIINFSHISFFNRGSMPIPYFITPKCLGKAHKHKLIILTHEPWENFRLFLKNKIRQEA
jgi:hypothetical protein